MRITVTHAKKNNSELVAFHSLLLSIAYNTVENFGFLRASSGLFPVKSEQFVFTIELYRLIYEKFKPGLVNSKIKLRLRLHGSGQIFARAKTCTVPPLDRRNWTNF